MRTTKAIISASLAVLSALLFVACSPAPGDPIQTGPASYYYIRELHPTAFSYPTGTKQHELIELLGRDTSYLRFNEPEFKTLTLSFYDGTAHQAINFTITSHKASGGNIECTLERVQHSGPNTGDILRYRLSTDAEFIHIYADVTYTIYGDLVLNPQNEHVVTRNTEVARYERKVPPYLSPSHRAQEGGGA
jgi:hypothetical protein